MTPSPTIVMLRRPRGFALPGYAAAAARKGHALGRPYCREMTREEAVAASRVAARLKRFVWAYRRAGVSA